MEGKQINFLRGNIFFGANALLFSHKVIRKIPQFDSYSN
jgi:hypothetical protein